MAILIKTDGTIVEDIAIDSLAKQQDLVDGYIEYVYKDDKVNEEGLLRSLPINETATEMYGTILVGDVIVTDSSEID
jgi:hypothetical protein